MTASVSVDISEALLAFQSPLKCLPGTQGPLENMQHI